MAAFKHVDVVKTTCGSSNQASDRGRKMQKFVDLLGFSHRAISGLSREWSSEKIST